MRFGLVISILLHAIVIGLLVITIERSVPFLADQLDIPVEVVTVADQANVKAATKDVKPEEEMPAPEPEITPPPAAAAPEPEPEAAPPEPKSEAPPKEEPRAEVRPQARPTPPKKTEKPKEDKFDLDAISVLIDKSRKAQEKQQTAEASPSDTSEEPRESVGEGDDMTITLVQLMQRQVEPCWNFPAGAVQPEKLDVYVTIFLRPDGTLSDPPAIENQGEMGDPYFRAAAEAAVRALNRCQPYDLPGDQYDVWKEVRLNFDPSRMIGM